MAEAKAKKPFHEIVAENLIAQLKEGTAPMAEAMESGRTRCRSSHEPYHR
uniref:DNA primase n=1 Tax=Escherichia coli TaxID=562 RepID=A0A5S9GFC4_ECOLX|nr:DNA primase [Escherichia coli]